MNVEIMDTAFVKYLRSLPLEQRVEHLGDCFVGSGEMFWELAEHFNEWNPIKLARLVGENENS